MCGIIGVASTGLLVECDKKFFRQALYCDQLRGYDSTGIFTVDKDVVPKVEVFKRAYPASDFLTMRKPEKMINGLGAARVMVGHNRAATKGSVNNSNAHPFQYGDITLVHNGTLQNYNKLPGWTYTENDSKLLTRGIAELGIQGAVDCIGGAWSLVWHDATDNTLNFLRNEARPMALASNNGRKDLYFASELMMLDWLTARNSIKVDEILNTEVNQHIKLCLDDASFNPVVKQVVKKTVFSVAAGGLTKKHERKPAVKQGELNVKARDTLLASKLKQLSDEGATVPVVGQKCRAYFYNHTPYKKGEQDGVMLGTMSNSPWLMCEIHNQKSGNFAEGYYEFQICGRRIEGGLASGEVELLGHAPRIVEGKKKEPKVFSSVTEVTVPKKSASPWAEHPIRAAIAKVSPPNTPIMTQSTTRTKLSLVSDSSVKANDWRAAQKKLQATKLLDKEVGRKIKDAIATKGTVLRHKPDFDADYPYAGANGSSLNQEVYDKLTRHGCCQCGGNISDDDAPDLLWVDTVSPLCLDCQSEREYGLSMDVDGLKKTVEDIHTQINNQLVESIEADKKLH